MALGISKLGAPAPEYSVIGHNIRIKFKALFKVDGGLNGGLKPDERELEVVEILQNNQGLTVEEVAVIMKLSKRTVERIFATLKQQGIIEKYGSKKSGTWIVKSN